MDTFSPQTNRIAKFDISLTNELVARKHKTKNRKISTGKKSKTNKGIGKDPKTNLKFNISKNISSLKGAFKSEIREVTKGLNYNETNTKGSCNRTSSVNRSINLHAIDIKTMPQKPNNMMTQRVSMSRDFIFENDIELGSEKMENNNSYKCICQRKTIRSPNPCSNYCAYLTPNAQKDIILSDNCKLKSYFSNNTNLWYAVSASWWKQWCDFVNIEFQPLRSIHSPVNQLNSGKTIFKNYYEIGINLYINL